MRELFHQAGAIPYAVIDGEMHVLLITSRDTGRWVTTEVAARLVDEPELAGLFLRLEEVLELSVDRDGGQPIYATGILSRATEPSAARI